MLTNTCPIPINDYPNILLAHGGGGRLMHQLIDRIFVESFGKFGTDGQHDGAVFPVSEGRLAFTTDSYVVHPLFFPGGNIGSLAVYGTVNDLAMCGARPLYLSAGFIIEEGLPVEVLWTVAQTMAECARLAGVRIITGDTKVVERGNGDGLFINTAGVGVIEHQLVIAPRRIKPGDAILINGDVGRHGMAIMAVREGLEFESDIETDAAPLNHIVGELLSAGIEIHCLRDMTRGGLASTIVELAEDSGWTINLDESAIFVREDVRGASELLGLDPLYIANEGKFGAFVPARDAEKALAIMRQQPDGQHSAIIGTVSDKKDRRVILKNRFGAGRILDMLSGEQLPRIC